MERPIVSTSAISRRYRSTVDQGGLVDRRRVSVQWFSGTILTGLCGAALMGGAVFASLDGQSHFATVPERVQVALRGYRRLDRSLRDRASPTGCRRRAKTDANRRVIRVTTTGRVGNREVVRVRPFVRVSGNLALSVSELSSNIPAFNPAKMLLAEGGPRRAAADNSPDADIDAEVSFLAHELGGILARARDRRRGANRGRPRQCARRRQLGRIGVGPRPAAPDLPRNAEIGLCREGIPDPYAGFEARMAPENVTLLPKTMSQATGGTAWSERTITLRRGKSVATVLRGLGTDPGRNKGDRRPSLVPADATTALRENHKLRILLAPTDDPKRVQPIRVVVANDTSVEAVVALSDLGRYVSVDVRNMDTEVARARPQEEEEDDGKGVRLYQSLYETALRNQRAPPADRGTRPHLFV